MNTEVVVVGSGPGGYTAAFRAADLGKKVVLVEKFENIGGVCLNVGCIPSKSLLHFAKLIRELEHFADLGLDVDLKGVKLDKLKSWKSGIVSKLTGGLKALAKRRKVEIVTGTAKFIDKNTLSVTNTSGDSTEIKFEHAIVAVGSQPIMLPFLPKDPRVIDSTGALELQEIPKTMLIIGGGIIGMEMATVYTALGTSVDVVELTDSLIPGADPDLVKPFYKKMQKHCRDIFLNTKIVAAEADSDKLTAKFIDKNSKEFSVSYDQILCAVGRKSNGNQVGLAELGVKITERGYIEVNSQQQTNISNIYAIGDCVGDPMLAHKAAPQAKVAAEVICGKKHHFQPKCIPSVAYTDPEIAWTGLTELEAKSKGIDYGVGVFPWAASGRALCQESSHGSTKVLFDKSTNRVIGGGIVGPHAGDLISELSLAIEMGCDCEDLSLTIHPHPTLVETIALAAEVYEGTVTDL